MNCTPLEFFDAERWQFMPVLFFSSTQANAVHTDAHITNADNGYATEMKAVGQAAATVGSERLVASPYTTRLRPVSYTQGLVSKNPSLLLSVNFYAYDTTLEGAIEQDAATLTSIYSSRSANDAYAQSPFINSFIGSWQPNYFRPAFLVNGRNVLSGLHASALGTNANKGDLSIGVPLPCCFQPRLSFGKGISKVEVSAQAAQQVSTLFQRYAILCLAEFLISNSPE